jgi:hypothetical protein
VIAAERPVDQLGIRQRGLYEPESTDRHARHAELRASHGRRRRHADSSCLRWRTGVQPPIVGHRPVYLGGSTPSRHDRDGLQLGPVSTPTAAVAWRRWLGDGRDFGTEQTNPRTSRRSGTTKGDVHRRDEPEGSVTTTELPGSVRPRRRRRCRGSDANL